jgi:uncharacterized membrane protein YidH (DUF202 family)
MATLRAPANTVRQKNDVLSFTIIGIFVLTYAAAVAAWAKLIWVIACKLPAQANRTPELVQIIRSKAPQRPTLLL